jgi:hypothetical protein
LPFIVLHIFSAFSETFMPLQNITVAHNRFAINCFVTSLTFHLAISAV